MLNSAGKQQPGKGAIETLPRALAQLVLGPLRGAAGSKCTQPALQNQTQFSDALKTALSSANPDLHPETPPCQMTSSSVIGIL